MRRIILVIGLIAVFSTVSAVQVENDSIQKLQQQIMNLEKLNYKLSAQISSANSNIRKLETSLNSAADSLNVLRKELTLTNNNIKAMADKLELQMQQLSERTDSDISALSRKTGNNTLYLLLAVAAMALLTATLIFRLTGRLALVKTELSEQIKSTSGTIREDILKLDNQVFWSFDLQKRMKKTEDEESDEIDHSLALKVADEIIRIQRNISNMDPEIKGLKQLEFAVERIQENFKENGYEMVDLLNRPYDQGMKVSAKFKHDNTLKPGDQIITRIIKPQVNYNNVTIQEAQVEVSIGDIKEGSG